MRKHPRIPCHYSIYKSNGVFLGHADNISEEGIRLHTDFFEELTQDTVYQLRLETHLENLPCVYALAEIKWVRKDNLKSKTVGLQLTPSSKGMMEDLIEETLDQLFVA